MQREQQEQQADSAHGDVEMVVSSGADERRVVKRRRTVELAAVDAAASAAVHSASGFPSTGTAGRREALVAMVRRGLEILLPGDDLAAERARRLDSITEQAWELELQKHEDAPGGEAASELSQQGEGGTNSVQFLRTVQSLDTQQTPVLQYDTASDPSAANFVPMSVSSSGNSVSPEPPCNGTLPTAPSNGPRDSTSDYRATAGAVAARSPQQELVEAMHALLGPSYWYCEHAAALIAAEGASEPASQLQEWRQLWQEVQIYTEFASVSQALGRDSNTRADPPALLLLAVQQELRRLSCLVESTATAPEFAETCASRMAGSHAAATAHTEGTFAVDAANSIRQSVRSDQCWRMVRLLISVHGIGLHKALQIYDQQCSLSILDADKSSHVVEPIASQDGNSPVLVATDLGLTACQQLALNVRGPGAVPQVCQKTVAEEILRRLQAQSEVSAGGGIKCRCSTTRRSTDSADLEWGGFYALVVVVSYLINVSPHAGQIAGNVQPRSSGFGANFISRHDLTQHVEGLLRQLEQRNGSISVSPTTHKSQDETILPTVTTGRDDLQQAQFVIHGLAWDDDVGGVEDGAIEESRQQQQPQSLKVPSGAERLCAHVSLGNLSPLLLDLRVLPNNWSSLGRDWYSMGPACLSRRILAPHGTRNERMDTSVQRVLRMHCDSEH